MEERLLRLALKYDATENYFLINDDKIGNKMRIDGYLMEEKHGWI